MLKTILPSLSRAAKSSVLNKNEAVTSTAGWSSPVYFIRLLSINDLISIDLLVVLVFFDVERRKVEEAQLRGFGDGVQSVKQGQVERARPGRGVAKRPEHRARIQRQHDVRFLGSLAQVQHDVRPDQERGVRSLTRLQPGVVYQPLGCHGGLFEPAVDRVAKPVQHGQVERAKVGVVVTIDQFVVGAQQLVAGDLVRRPGRYRREVQAIFDDFSLVYSFNRRTHSTVYPSIQYIDANCTVYSHQVAWDTVLNRFAYACSLQVESNATRIERCYFFDDFVTHKPAVLLQRPYDVTGVDLVRELASAN